MPALVGQIKLFAFDFVPRGWMPCDGSMLPLRQYVPLFSLLGNTYGGDGLKTFSLPDLRGREPIAGSRYCICVEGAFPSRQQAVSQSGQTVAAESKDKRTDSSELPKRAANVAAGLIEIKVPDIGETDVRVTKIFVELGDIVARDAPIIEIESDKAASEIPSPMAGVVRHLYLKTGAKVSAGSRIMLLEATARARKPHSRPTSKKSVKRSRSRTSR